MDIMKLFRIGLFWTLMLFFCGVVIGERAYAAAVEVTWNANPVEDNVAYYMVYYGTEHEIYSRSVNAGQNTQADINNLQEGVTYHIAVKAYNASPYGSPFSDEVDILIPKSQIILDSDSDGIPDTVENSMGLDPLNPFDSVYDNDLDGFSNFTEYKSQTDMNDFLSFPDSDGYMIYMITEQGASAALDGIIPDNSLNVIPISSDFPAPVNLILNFQNEGLYFYNLIDTVGLIKYKLNISVTGSILLVAGTTAEEPLSVIDGITGIELDIPEGSSSEEFEVGIGLSLTQIEQQNVNGTAGYVFDILPYGKILKQQARIAVPYSGERPYVEMYDFTTEQWVEIKDEVKMDNNKAVFTTKILGRFRITETPQQNASKNIESLSSNEDAGSSGSGGGCFISSAISSL
jgi:hypothetical protein